MSIQGTEITLKKDCQATRIPSGEPVHLKEGESYFISQALGGSVTLKDSGGLYRLALEDLEGLGGKVAEEIRNSTSISSEAPFSEEAVWESLRQCFDPEIPVNIVDLGLIYSLQIEPIEGSSLHHVGVKMTLTATGCGMGPSIAADAKSKIESLAAVQSADVEIVWDPQWTPHMISGEGRKILGLD